VLAEEDGCIASTWQAARAALHDRCSLRRVALGLVVTNHHIRSPLVIAGPGSGSCFADLPAGARRTGLPPATP